MPGLITQVTIITLLRGCLTTIANPTKRKKGRESSILELYMLSAFGSTQGGFLRVGLRVEVETFQGEGNVDVGAFV